MEFIPGHWRAGARLALFRNLTAVGNVGGGTDTLQTDSLPASFFAVTGRGAHVTQAGTAANNSNPKTLVSQVGGQTLVSQALTVSVAGEWRLEYNIFSTGTNTQYYEGFLDYESAAGVWTTVVFQGTLALTASSAQAVRCTGTVTDGGGGINNDDISQKLNLIEVWA